MKIDELNHIVNVNGNKQQSENLQKIAFSIGLYWRGSFGLLDILVKNEKYLIFTNGKIMYSNSDNTKIAHNYKQVTYKQMMSIMKQIRRENEINTDNIIIIPDCYNSISKQDIKTIHEKLNNSQATKIVELQDEIDKLHLQLSQFKNKESKWVEHEIDYKSKFEKQVELNEKLTTMNEELLEKQKVLSNEVNNKDARISNLERHLEYNNQRIQVLKLSCDNLYNENTKLHNTIETINKQLNVLRLTNVKMYDMNKKQAIKIAELTERLTTIDTDFEVEETENEILLKQNVDKMRQNNIELICKLDRQKVKVTCLKYRINSLEAEIKRLEKDKTKLNAQIEQYIKIDIARNIINKQSYSICPKCQLNKQ